MEKFNKSAIVKKIIGTYLESRGFQYNGTDPERWCFSRVVGDIRQEVSIEKIHRVYLRLEFRTNAFGHLPLYAEHLVPKEELNEMSDMLGLCESHDEESFIKIIKWYQKIIEDYGEQALESISKPTTDAHPTDETNRILYENHQNLLVQAQEKFKLNDNNTPEEIIRKISDVIIETQNEEFRDIVNTLIELSSLYGDIYVKSFKGTWEWNKYNKCIVRISCKFPLQIFPLSLVISAWRESPETSFQYFLDEFNYTSKLVMQFSK